MDDDLSMDSFVDIVANTVGIVIILTMLTIIGIDRRGLEVDDALRSKMDDLNRDKTKVSEIVGNIMGKSEVLMTAGSDFGLKGLNLENMDGKVALAKATDLLKRMDEIRAKSEQHARDLDLAKIRRNDAEEKHTQEKRRLVDLRAKKKSLTDAMRTRKDVEAQLVTDLPGLNMSMDEFKGTPLTSLETAVKDLDNSIKTLEEKANINRKEFNDLQDEVARLTREKAALDKELASLGEVANLRIEIARPPSLGEQMKMPIFFECFSKAPEAGGEGELRVRFVRPGAPREGEPYISIGDASSAFKTFLADQEEESKASYRLHFIVRPDAGAAFRKARDIARAAGWSVGWNPIGKDVPLEFPGVSSAGAAESVSMLSATAPR